MVALNLFGRKSTPQNFRTYPKGYCNLEHLVLLSYGIRVSLPAFVLSKRYSSVKDLFSIVFAITIAVSRVTQRYVFIFNHFEMLPET